MDLSHFSITPEPARGFDFVEDVPRPRADVKPRAKISHDDKNEEPPLQFFTALGPRRIPKQRFPLRPSAEMTKDARQGDLTKFLRAGQIIRASDLRPMVDLKTAKLSLTDRFELETDHLSEEEQLPEIQRTEKKLFYIAVTTDELPSYHFWKAERDPDPIDARAAGHSQPLKPAKISPHGATVVANFQRKIVERRAEHKRQVAERKRQSKVKLNPKSTVKNAWTEAGDGEFYRRSNPKRESHLRTENPVGPSVEPQWRPHGTLLGVPFSSSDQRVIKDSGQFGPKPGDREWEEVEAAWEQRIQDVGLKSILEDLKKNDREKFLELSYGTKSFRIQPTRGDDEYARQFNDVLKTSIPTVAFKLTQQHFERPISAINAQEPLIRGANPQGWDLQGEEPEDLDGVYEVVPHEEDELGFLDFYNEKSRGEPMLRRRNPFAKEYILGELAARNPHLAVFGDQIFDQSTSQRVHVGSGKGLQSEFADYRAAPSRNYNRKNITEGNEYLSDDEVSGGYFSNEGLSDIEPSDEELAREALETTCCCIIGKKCSVFVKSLSYEEFCKAAHRVVAWEKGQSDRKVVKGFAFRIDPTDDSESHSYYIKSGSAEPPYFCWLFRELPDILIVTIRVAETKMDLPPVEEKIDPDRLQLIAPGFGHIITASDWQQGPGTLEDKASELLRTAIDFLFAEESTQVTGFGEFRISIPGYPDHHVDLQSEAELKQEMQEVLSEIAENANGDVHASIFIYEEEVQVTSEISEPYEIHSVWSVEGAGHAAWFDYRAPFMFELFELDVWEKVFKTTNKSTIIIIPNTKAWDLGLHSQTIGGKKPSITPREWNQYFNANFKLGESIRVMRLFRDIQVHDGTRITRNIESWRVADLYGESAFDTPGLMSSLAVISIRLLNIDPRKDNLGIKILLTKDKEHPAWEYFDSKTSERQFLQEIFFLIEEPSIEISPVARNEVPPWPIRRKRESQVRLTQRRKSAGEQLQRHRTLLQQAKNPSQKQRSEAVQEWQASQLRPESDHNDKHGEIGIPQYSLSFEPEIRVGPDFPTIYPRILTLAEIEHLKRQLRLREDQILQRENLIVERTLQPILRQEQPAHLGQTNKHKSPVRPEVIRAITSKLPKKYNDKWTQTRGSGPVKKARQVTQTEGLSSTRKSTQTVRAPSVFSNGGIEKTVETDNLSTKAASAAPESGTGGNSQDEPPPPPPTSPKSAQGGNLQDEPPPPPTSPKSAQGGNLQDEPPPPPTSPKSAQGGNLQDEPPPPPTSPKSAQGGNLKDEPPPPTLPESGPGGHLQDEPPPPTLPPKEKGKSYYCNICYIDTTRKNPAKKIEHALECGTTIDKTLMALSKADAMHKKQITPTTPVMKKKPKAGKPVTPDPTPGAPRTRSRKATSPLAEGLVESDNDLSSPGRLKRKRTRTPTAGKKAAPNKRRR